MKGNDTANTGPHVISGWCKGCHGLEIGATSDKEGTWNTGGLADAGNLKTGVPQKTCPGCRKWIADAKERAEARNCSVLVRCSGCIRTFTIEQGWKKSVRNLMHALLCEVGKQTCPACRMKELIKASKSANKVSAKGGVYAVDCTR